MDGGIDPPCSPIPAPAGSSTTPMWRLSGTGTTCLTAACIVLLLLFLTGRFLWHYNKGGAAAAQATAPVSSSSSTPAPADPQPAGCVVGNAAAAAALMSLLPVLVHVGPEAAECAVCLTEFAEGDAGRALPRCGHGFHEACIATWLRVNTTCPLCRAHVASPKLVSSSGEIPLPTR